jgi:hypothetical protein
MLATAIKNHGRRILIKITAPMMLESVLQNIRRASPSMLSSVSTSLANRFMIRPSGVVSKKDIGA